MLALKVIGDVTISLAETALCSGEREILLSIERFVHDPF